MRNFLLLLTFFGVLINALGQGPWDISDQTSGGNNVTASLNQTTGVLTINGIGKMADFWCSAEWAGEAPWRDEGYHTVIKTVVMQGSGTDNLLNIGDRAFKDCSNLETISIPNTVTIIGKQAFMNCVKLYSVSIPNSVNMIEGRAFYGCSSLEIVEIVNGTNLLEFRGYTSGNPCDPWVLDTHEWFNGCYLLKTLYWGRNLNFPFYNTPTPITDITSSLTTLIIGNTVGRTNATPIRDKAFENCGKLSNVIIEDDCTTLFFDHYCDPFKGCGNIDSVYLGRNLSYYNISNDALFRGKTNLTKLAIGDCVTKIGDELFYGCSGLLSVTIPNSVETIEDNAFYNCEKLGILTLGNNVTEIGQRSFYQCRDLKTLTIPQSVNKIKDKAFANCNNLTDVIIMGGSTTLFFDYSCDPFAGCGNIETVCLDRNLSYYSHVSNECLFRGKTKLTKLTIGDYVTKIGSNLFYGCGGLLSVHFPSSIEEIGDYAFYGCCGLKEITCYSIDPPTIYANTFGGCGKSIPNCTVYVIVCEFLSKYENAPFWKNFSEIKCCVESIDETPLTQIAVYPNPTSDEIFIQSELKIEKVEVYSLIGTLLISKNDFSVKISVSTLSQGVYLLKVYTDKGVAVRKFMKE